MLFRVILHIYTGGIIQIWRWEIGEDKKDTNNNNNNL